MTKKILFGVIFVVALFFLFAPQKSSAAFYMNELFCREDSGNCYTGNTSISVIQTRQTESLIQVSVAEDHGGSTIAVNGADPDPQNSSNALGYTASCVANGNNPCLLGANVDLGDLWNSIWNNLLFTESSGSYGIYIDVGYKVKIGSQITELTNSSEPAQIGPGSTSSTSSALHVDYIVQDPNVQLAVGNGTPGPTIINGYLGLSNRDTFGKQLILGTTMKFPVMKLVGLTAGKTYFIRVRLEEQDPSTDFASSKVYKFSTPTTGSQTFTTSDVSQVTIENQANSENNATIGLPECGVFGDSSVMGCVAQIVYYFVFVPTSFIMRLTGEIMDWGLGYSIDSASYSEKAGTFVASGWRIMRDLANMMFIFILLYIAIATILDIGNVDPKKMIGTVILVALLINFSLFFTKVVVDAGNIVARLFYNQITVQNSATGAPINSSESKYKSISYAFAAKFNPLKLMSGLNSQVTITNGNGDSIGAGVGPGEFASYYALFSFVGAIVNLIAAFIFFMMAWLFIARTVGIWLAMIFAPLAIIGFAIPGGKGLPIDQLNPQKWKDNLIKMAFMPAIAMLMLYLILQFLKADFVTLSGSNTTTGNFMAVLIPLIVITILLFMTRKTAESLSGDVATWANKVGSFVGGAALGLATGGAAMVGRATIGAGAGALAESSAMRDWASKSRIGKFALQRTRDVSNATFDARNVKVMGKDLGGVTGMGVGKVTSKGYLKDQEAKAMRQKSFADSLGRASNTEKAMLNKFENEYKRKKLLMDRGERDPYTGNIPTPDEVAAANAKATNEQNRLDRTGRIRRENVAQQVEQGSSLPGYLINKASRPILKLNEARLQRQLTQQQAELTQLGRNEPRRDKNGVHLRDTSGNLLYDRVANIGAPHPTEPGRTITQADYDRAQKRVDKTEHYIKQAETGYVTSANENTANEIRTGKPGKGKVDPKDPDAVIKLMTETYEDMKNKLDEKPDQDQPPQPQTSPQTGGHQTGNPPTQTNASSTSTGTGSSTIVSATKTTPVSKYQQKGATGTSNQSTAPTASQSKQTIVPATSMTNVSQYKQKAPSGTSSQTQEISKEKNRPDDGAKIKTSSGSGVNIPVRQINVTGPVKINLKGAGGAGGGVGSGEVFNRAYKGTKMGFGAGQIENKAEPSKAVDEMAKTARKTGSKTDQNVSKREKIGFKFANQQKKEAETLKTEERLVENKARQEADKDLEQRMKNLGLDLGSKSGSINTDNETPIPTPPQP